MVRIEVGGRKVLEIPGVDIGERNIGSQTTIRRSFTDSHGNTIRSGKGLNFNWNSIQPRLCVTSDTEDFDEEILSNFQEEGFQVSYLPYTGNKSSYQRQLQHLADPLELGETYAIVAYGDAAALTLEIALRPAPKLCAVVAYYPHYMPKSSVDFPHTLNLLMHLAGSQRFGVKHRQSFRYAHTEPGFAESDLDEFNKPAARVAWSRTLAMLRTGFGIQGDIEAIWDKHLSLRDEISSKDDVDNLLETMMPDISVNYIPTMTGGIGKKRLRRFYLDFFARNHPKDFKSVLASRTVGTDRVVDELAVSFTHDIEIPWLLPGVPSTGKKIEIAMVFIISVRGGKICTENVYWDQASVLLQIGLIDPSYIPGSFQTQDASTSKEMARLPISGAEAAHKVLDEESGRSNKLIPDW